MLHGLDLPAAAFDEVSTQGLPPTQWRTVNVPGISVRVSEMVAALLNPDP